MTTVKVAPESVTDETPENVDQSKKRKFIAAATATTVTVLLGLAASGVINRIGETVKSKIAPETEKSEDE